MSLANDCSNAQRILTTRRLKRLATATAVASLVTVLFPAAAGAAKRRTVAPVVLGAENLVTGSSSGTALVTVPRDATFDGKTGDNPYFRFTGGGRFAGVLLASAGSDLIRDGVLLFVGRYGFCGTPGCTPKEMTQVLTLSGTDGEAVLPAGNYRLYLVAEDAASVHMKLDGLSGKTTIVPDGRIDAKVSEPESAISAPRNVAYSSGQAYDFKGAYGFTFKVLSIAGEAWAAGRYGSCIYRGNPPLPRQLAYNAPGCPGGLSLAQVDASARVSDFRIDHYATTVYDPGEWTVSSFYEAGGLIEGANALDVAVDLPAR
jgi:hypothetical protein